MGLSLRRFRAGWGRRCVVEELDLTLASGELLMIVGPGGSGKSTLLAAIERIINSGTAATPNHMLQESGLWWDGEVEIAFELAERLDQRGREDSATPRELFAAIGVEFGDVNGEEPGARPWVWPSEPALRAELDGALDVPLTGVADPLRRMICLLWTASTEAGLLLFDEPELGQRGPWLDHVHVVLAELRRTRKSMVAVTHYLPLARTMADHVVLMIDGRVIEMGPTQEFFEAPRQPRTQQFIQWGT